VTEFKLFKSFKPLKLLKPPFTSTPDTEIKRGKIAVSKMSFRVEDEKSFFVLVENAKSLAVLEMTR